jgi:hypothetical protein
MFQIYSMYLFDTEELPKRLEYLHPLVHLPPRPGCSVNWMSNIYKFEKNIHSQGGQDGVLENIFANIGVKSRFYVEIGFNSMDWGFGSNTYALHDQGWNGLLIDIEKENIAINLVKHKVTPENIEGILDLHNVPREPDYISIDIDSTDLWIARSIMLSEKYRPRVISLEYNCHLPIGSTVTVDPDFQGWNGYDVVYGASAGAIKAMSAETDYTLVHLSSTYDAFLVRNDLLNGHCPPALASFANRVRVMHNCVMDDNRRGLWRDYWTYVNTGGDKETSTGVALEQMLLMTSNSQGTMDSPACLGFM